MFRVLRLLPAALLACVIVAPAQARLGETLAQLKKRLGDPEPLLRRDKNTALWFFEVEDGRLMYNVTFNSEGVSIAEGLKPVKRAKLSRAKAEDFIQAQLAVHGDSTTVRTFRRGEKYGFAGRSFTCGPHEVVIVDEPNGLLIVWSQSALPTIMAVSPEMIR